MRISDWSSDVCSSDLQSKPEVRDIYAGQADSSSHTCKQQPSRNHPAGTEARDKPTRKKAGSVHGDYMPLKPQIRAFLRVTAQLHRQRRSGHQEIHKHVRDRSATPRSNKKRSEEPRVGKECVSQ